MSIPGGITLRPYQGGDETGIVATWNRALTTDPINLRVFVKQVLCDANFDPAGLQVAEADKRIVGFCLAIVRRLPMVGTDLEPGNGWITAMGVDPDWQRQGVGAALLEKSEAFLKAKGRTNVFVSSYAPNYFWPGVDEQAYAAAVELFKNRGYSVQYSPVAMDKNLVLYKYPEDVREVEKARLEEGYKFELLTPRYLDELIRFANDVFNPDWGRAIREAVAAGIPLDQFNIAIHPSGRLVGFALYGGYGGVQERFGPFGVDESERGKGLGKILLYQCMQGMQSKGLHGAWFLWTGETSPAGYLYFRAGFEVTRKFHVMNKKLAAS